MIVLGFDFSTQSASVVGIDVAAAPSYSVVLKRSLPFALLPKYNARNGYIENDDGKECHADPLMWLEALDMLLQQCIDEDHFDFSQVIALSGSGQQHGSVYLNQPLCLDFSSKSGDDATNLSSIVQPMLARKTAPIWMDSSTSAECDEINANMGGSDQVLKVSGCMATERFTGPQIRKFWKESPVDYGNTKQIHVVSSFMCSILLGRDAPIEAGDAAGMNLMDIRSRDWSVDLMNATAPNLREKLPSIVKQSVDVGKIAPYFGFKYGFNAETRVIAWTGDNICSFVGVGGSFGNNIVISLGTSDTVICKHRLDEHSSSRYGNIFSHPVVEYIRLTCFSNGSLARERVRENLHMNWDEFNAAIDQLSSASASNIYFPYYVPEITPKISRPCCFRSGTQSFETEEKNSTELCRAIVETQALSLRYWGLGWKTLPHITSNNNNNNNNNPIMMVIVTGGASSNRSILQILANVLGCNIATNFSDSASLGAAMLAIMQISPVNRQLYDNLILPNIQIQCGPNVDREHYDGMLNRYLQLLETQFQIQI